jgi:hypothetical protein
MNLDNGKETSERIIKMSLNKNRQKEKKARDIICKALKDLEGDHINIPDFSEYNIRENEFNNKLTRLNIDAGIRAFYFGNKPLRLGWRH